MGSVVPGSKPAPPPPRHPSPLSREREWGAVHVRPKTDSGLEGFQVAWSPEKKSWTALPGNSVGAKQVPLGLGPEPWASLPLPYWDIDMSLESCSCRRKEHLEQLSPWELLCLTVITMSLPCSVQPEFMAAGIYWVFPGCQTLKTQGKPDANMECVNRALAEGLRGEKLSPQRNEKFPGGTLGWDVKDGAYFPWDRKQNEFIPFGKQPENR